MNSTDFLNVLKSETERAVAGLMLPLAPSKDERAPEPRPAEVYLMRLPDSKIADQKVPYIIHSLLTTSDKQEHGKPPTATVTVRSIFTVYGEDEQKGALNLLTLMDTVRSALLRSPLSGTPKRYRLDLAQGLERLIYTDNSAPYFGGEMSSVWVLPSIQREDVFDLL